MMDMSSFVDGTLAILGMVAVIMVAGLTMSSQSSTVSAPERAHLDQQARDHGWPKKAA
jgi:hypothetical protein